MPPDKELSGRQAAFLWRLLYVFRRQLPREIADEAVRRKVDHQWQVAERVGWSKTPVYRCIVCGYPLTSERERNAPCPGPPEPKPSKKRRKAKTAPKAAAPAPVPQDSLFGAVTELRHIEEGR